VTDSDHPIELVVRAGRIYQNRGAATLSLFRTNTADWKDNKPEATVEVPPDGREHPVKLQPKQTGSYAVVVSDAAAGTVVRWPKPRPMTVVSSLDQPANFYGRWSLCFYVPSGTKFVGGFSAGPGRLLDGDGKVVFTFKDKPGYFRVLVSPGQDVRLWRFDRCAGQHLLMTVPPCLARSREELLLPAEVVNAEKNASE